jgi:branched-chain amino acid transport system ATP-binding protein
MPLLAVENLSKSFGAVKVADNVSFSLEEGETLGIIGPNGAGKTSLFNLLTGNLRPAYGRIFFREKEITGTSPQQRCRAGIGRTYQIPQPFSKMTVLENCLVAASFGTGHSERQSYAHCAQILKRTGLLRKANVPAGSLTLLERKALELARALSSSPRLLLLDEIAGGLTEHEAAHLIGIIKEIHAAGTTIIWIEHIVHALVAAVSRLLVINFGAMVMDGEPSAVMNSAEVKRIYMGIEVE